MDVVSTLDILAPIVGDAAQTIGHDDALDDQRLVLEDNLADRLDVEVILANLDMTRFQRAGKGARQSPAGGRDHVVQRGGAGWKVARGDAVMLGDLGMDAERHRLLFGRQVRQPLGPAQALDPNPGRVGNPGHMVLLSSPLVSCLPLMMPPGASATLMPVSRPPRHGRLAVVSAAKLWIVPSCALGPSS
jgi:hypothetical protein